MDDLLYLLMRRTARAQWRRALADILAYQAV
jgi:hypothetical protein